MRHCQVEQEDVGLDLAGQFDGLSAVAGFAHDFHVRLGFQQAAQTVPEDRVIVSDHDAYGMTMSIHDSSFAGAECGPLSELHVPVSILS